MDLFVGNVPPDVVPNELRRIFERPLFRGLPPDCRIGVVRARDERGRELVYGLISGLPDRTARRLIRRLNSRRYRGRLLMVRPFVHRAYSNERRALNWRERPWPWDDRRTGERRCFFPPHRLDDMAVPASPAYHLAENEADWDALALELEAYPNLAIKRG